MSGALADCDTVLDAAQLGWEPQAVAARVARAESPLERGEATPPRP